MMYRVKAKIAVENDKKQLVQGQKRAAPEEKLNAPRAQQRRRSSQQKGGSAPSTITPSPNTISPVTPNLPILTSSAPTGSPPTTFTPTTANGTQSFTPQSQSGSSPGGSELIYPFALGQQGLYTSFGNSPPLFPLALQQQQQVQFPADMVSHSREDDGTGPFWQSLFGPPGGSLPLPQHLQGFNQLTFAPTQQQATVSPNRTTGEFRDPNDLNLDFGGDNETPGVKLDEIDGGLVDWGDFIAQCSQVWVTE